MAPLAQGNFAIVLRYQRWMIRVRELSRTEHGTELATKSKKHDSTSHQ
jgi:hypothetical protein